MAHCPAWTGSGLCNSSPETQHCRLRVSSACIWLSSTWCSRLRSLQSPLSSVFLLFQPEKPSCSAEKGGLFLNFYFPSNLVNERYALLLSSFAFLKGKKPSSFLLQCLAHAKQMLQFLQLWFTDFKSLFWKSKCGHLTLP